MKSRILISAAFLLAPLVAQAQQAPPAASTMDATFLYTMFCIDNLPDFEGTVPALESNGLYEEADTGTMYHQNIDLSFKVFEHEGATVCSMVFKAKEDQGMASIMLGAYIDLKSEELRKTHPNAELILNPSTDYPGYYRIGLIIE